MSLTKEDLKNIKDLFKEKFENIDNRFLNFDKRFENLEEILANNFELIANHFKTIEEDIEYLKEKGNLYELSFNKMNERLDCIDRNVLELRARENLNRDRLDRVEINIDDVRRVTLNTDLISSKLCDKEKRKEYSK